MANTYLTRTQSMGNRTTFTFSAWVKRSSLGEQNLITVGTSGTSRTQFHFQGQDALQFYNNDGGSVNMYIKTNRLFRDLSAWYHIVLRFDTTQSTASDRIRFYVNGEEETSLATNTIPSEDADNTQFNYNGIVADIGRRHYDATGYFDGSMSHVHFCDGQSYDASAFGETDSLTGIWKPKTAPSVTYGTNGFFLKFENSAAFGTDSSGNANTFTVNGTMTQNIDTPSNVFATWNPLGALSTPPTFSNGNTTAALPTSGGAFRSTLAASSGKYYCEVKVTSLNNAAVGIQPIDSAYNVSIFGDTSGIGLYGTNGEVYKNGSNIGAVASVSDNNIIGMAIDLDNNNIYFSVNGQYASGISGSWNQAFGSAYAVAINSGHTYAIAGVNGSSGSTSNISINFGNGYFGTTAVSSAQNPDDGIGIFEYDVPTGYYALNTKAINAQEYD